jgi:hypothetical protein
LSGSSQGLDTGEANESEFNTSAETSVTNRDANDTIVLFKKRGKFKPEKAARKMNAPFFIEYLLVYWVTMFMVEEFVQVKNCFYHFRPTFKVRLIFYGQSLYLVTESFR